MKKLISAVWILFVCVSCLSAKDLETYSTIYDKQLAGIVVQHLANLIKLNESYAASLNSLCERTTDVGDLDTTQAVMAEIVRFTAENTVSKNQAMRSVAEIKRLQLGYLQSVDDMELGRAREVVSLTSRYDAALGRLQIALTRQKKIDDAIAVKDERKVVAESEEYKAARAKLESTDGGVLPKPEPSKADTIPKRARPVKAVSAVALNKGLVVHYTFDLDKRDRIADKSKKRHHGMAYGEPQKAKGVIGTALVFDGVKDFVELPKKSKLMNLPDQDFTICAWYRPNGVPAGEFDRGVAAIVARQGYHFGLFYHADETFEAAHWFDTGDRGEPKHFTVRSESYDVGEWYHVAEVVSVKDKTIKLFVNGEVAAEEVSPYKWTSHLNDQRGWRIGIAAPNSKTCRSAANGLIDDVRIYDRALSRDEVRKLHESVRPRR